MHLFTPESQSLITISLLLTPGELTDNKILHVLFTINSDCLAKALLSPVTLLLSHSRLMNTTTWSLTWVVPRILPACSMVWGMVWILQCLWSPHLKPDSCQRRLCDTISFGLIMVGLAMDQTSVCSSALSFLFLLELMDIWSIGTSYWDGSVTYFLVSILSTSSQLR